MSGVMNNEINKEKKWISCKLTSTKCKKSVAFAQDWSHTLFQTSSNNHALVDIDEKQIICYFIQLGRVLRQLLTLLRQYIVGPTLPPPYLRGEVGGGGRNFQKLSHLGVSKILVERGNNPEKGGLMWKWGSRALPLFCYFYLLLFLIHSDSLKIMLTALFKLVWNTQKSTRIIFF